MARTSQRAVRGLAGMSFSMLQAELSRRGRTVRVLERQRDRLLAQLDQIEAEIRDLGGGNGSGTRRRAGGRPDIGRKRPRNESQLVDVLAKVLDGKTLSVTDAMEAVQRAGYRTSAANFRVIVNGALIRDKRFKKVGRGQYTLK